MADNYIGIPTVDPSTSIPDASQTANINPDAFGAGLGKAVQNFGASVTKTVDLYNETATDEAQNQLVDLWTKRMHGDPSKMVEGPDGKPMPDSGYLGTKGRTAMDQRLDVQKSMDDDINTIMSGLKTQEQREAFKKVATRYKNGVFNQIGSHSNQQQGVWVQGVNAATGQQSLRQIGINADNPEGMAAWTADLINARVKSVQAAGGGEAEIAEAVASGRRDALKMQVETISARDPLRALRILEKNRAAAGESYVPLYGQLRARADKQQGDEASVEAINGSVARPSMAVAAPGLAGTTNALIKNGLPRIAAAALAGNIAGEGGTNPNSRNVGDGKDGSDSIGIVQWNSDRAKNLMKFAADMGKPWNDRDVQLAFVVHELKNDPRERKVYEKLINAKTIDEANAIAVGYFRPKGWTENNPSAAHNYNYRASQGRAAYAALEGKPIGEQNVPPGGSVSQTSDGRRVVVDAKGNAIGGTAPAATGEESTPKPQGQIEAGNIDLANRPRVQNEDGTVSTVRSISIGVDGKEYLIPTVSDDGRVLTDEEATEQFKKTGKHLGAFDTPANATAFAKRLHDDQERMVKEDVTRPAQTREEALRRVEQRPDLSPEAKAYARTAVNQAWMKKEQDRAAWVDDIQYKADHGQYTVAQADADWAARRFKNYEEYASVKRIAERYAGDTDLAANTALKIYSGGLFNPMDPDDKKGLTAFDQRSGLLDGLKKMDKTAKAQAVMQFSKTGMISDIQKGMFEAFARTGTDAQIEFSMSTLDAMYNANPHAFTVSLGNENYNALQKWQSVANHDPKVFREELRKGGDPVFLKANEEMIKRAEKTVRDMSDGDILHAFDAWPWVPGTDPAAPIGMKDYPGMEILRGQYAKEYSDAYVNNGGNDAASKRQALDNLKTRWGDSSLAGGRLTEYPPELFLPRIGGGFRGGHEWAKKQVENALAEIVGIKAVTGAVWMGPSGQVVGTQGGQAVPTYALVADRETKVEIDALRSKRGLPGGRLSPSWTLNYVDPETGLIKSGGRFSFDVQAARKENNAAISTRVEANAPMNAAIEERRLENLRRSEMVKEGIRTHGQSAAPSNGAADFNGFGGSPTPEPPVQ